MNPIQKIQETHRNFIRERNWDQFQTPKNLSMAISAEAAELLEVFMWMTEKQASSLTPEQKSAAADEMADVLINLSHLAGVLEIDLIEAAERKMKKNGEKYSIEKGRILARQLAQTP